MAYQTQGFTLDNSGRRVVVDPVTRIEGHLRCEVSIAGDRGGDHRHCRAVVSARNIPPPYTPIA